MLRNKLVVIIKGNPDRMVGKEKLAENYYQEIADFVESYGFNVIMDPGAPYTCPDMDAAFWIAHSRGVDRVICVKAKDTWRFIKFGHLDGVSHPKDIAWLKSFNPDSPTQPPKEHFYFTVKQREAIVDVINRL